MVVLLIICVLTPFIFAADYYVATDGNDKNVGTIDSPFHTIQKAADKMIAADTCYIRAGTYHQAVVIGPDHPDGSSDSPITFTAYPGTKVILDGTEAIKSKWTRHKGSIYKTKLTEDIWQLFVDGQMMTPARWPNAVYGTEKFWDQDATWAHQNINSTNGLMVDESHDNVNLADLDFSVKGAMAVMNIGHWMTYTRKIKNHIQKTNLFTYEPVKFFKTGKSTKKVIGDGRYFLECKLELLDQPQEWFYDPATKELYLWPDDGKDPTGRNIRGKTQTYAFDINKTDGIRIADLNFFATTFSVQYSSHFTIENCNLQYFSYSKRMLGSEGGIDTAGWSIMTRIIGPNGPNGPDESGTYNTVKNSIFEHSDGSALYLVGRGDRIENCYFSDLDWAGIGQWTIRMAPGTEGIFRRNTVHHTGSGQTFKSDLGCLIEFNHFYNNCLMQGDCGQFQISPRYQNATVARYNWVYHGPLNPAKRNNNKGIRFDGHYARSPRETGRNVTAHHNVVWDSGMMLIKMNEHKIYNNLCFDNTLTDFVIQADKKDRNGENADTITWNNLAGQLSGSRADPNFPIPGIHSKNWVGDIRTQLRDPDNFDFRPKPDSDLIDAGYQFGPITNNYLGKNPDVGPYECGDPNYWIPGYQALKASTPIPPNGSKTVKPTADIMWLGGYQAKSHNVYFGKDYNSVEKGNTSSPEYKGKQLNNIFAPGILKAGTYYWRIDAIISSGIAKGDIWSFTVRALKD
jgi:hypothetical protein